MAFNVVHTTLAELLYHFVLLLSSQFKIGRVHNLLGKQYIIKFGSQIQELLNVAGRQSN